MNRMLRCSGYPLVAGRPRDRTADVAALQMARAGAGVEGFDRLLYERLEVNLGFVSAPYVRRPRFRGRNCQAVTLNRAARDGGQAFDAARATPYAAVRISDPSSPVARIA